MSSGSCHISTSLKSNRETYDKFATHSTVSLKPSGSDCKKHKLNYEEPRPSEFPCSAQNRVLTHRQAVFSPEISRAVFVLHK